MELHTIRPNIVQSIRAYRVDDLMAAARSAGQHFLYANISEAQSKQEVLEGIAQAFAKSAARSLGGSVVRGLLGSILKR